jgi:hypothetical protein
MSRPAPYGARDNWRIPVELGPRKAIQVFIVRLLVVAATFVFYLPLLFLLSVLELSFLVSMGVLSLTVLWVLAFTRYLLPVVLRLSIRNPMQVVVPEYEARASATTGRYAARTTGSWVRETIDYAKTGTSRERGETRRDAG